MNKSAYFGETFSADSPFHLMLTARNHLVTKTFGSNGIIVAAPHHTPNGVSTMPCGRVGDENAGYHARNLAALLLGEMVVAANADYDPNKEPGPYLEHVLPPQKQPYLLVETHGHGGSMTENHIEISCGAREYNAYSMQLAENVRSFLQSIAAGLSPEESDVAEYLRTLKVSGDVSGSESDPRTFYYTAFETLSLKQARDLQVLPFHIEYVTALRKSSRGTKKSLPKAGVYATQAIAAAISSILPNFLIRQRSDRLDSIINSNI